MIKSLQSLRIVFAIVIFLHHYQWNGESLFMAGGSMGVCFFLMLSGFAMSMGYGEKVMSEDFSFRRYFVKRLVRLWPLHLLCLLVYVLMHFQKCLSLGRISILGLNALMLQSWIPVREVYFSGNAVSWCLCDLMFCYAMFPLLYRSINRVNDKTLSIGAGILLLVYFSVIWLIPENYIHAFIDISPIFRLIDFILGILAYRIFTRLSQNERVSHLLANSSKSMLTVLELAVIGLFVGGAFLYPVAPVQIHLASLWWICCFIAIVLFPLLEISNGGYVTGILKMRRFVSLSPCSFTFYMIHLLAVPVILQILSPLQMPYPITLLICILLTWALAWAVNKYFEKPVANGLIKAMA